MPVPRYAYCQSKKRPVVKMLAKMGLLQSERAARCTNTTPLYLRCVGMGVDQARDQEFRRSQHSHVGPIVVADLDRRKVLHRTNV